jgi:hypothetical protein
MFCCFNASIEYAFDEGGFRFAALHNIYRSAADKADSLLTGFLA